MFGHSMNGLRIGLAAAALLTSAPAAKAELGEYNTGVETKTKSWGKDWGHKDWARLGVHMEWAGTIIGTGAQNGVAYTDSNMNTWADAYVLSHRTVFWDVSTRASNYRMGPTNPNGNQRRSYASANIFIDGTQYHSLGISDFVTFNALSSGARSLGAAKLAGGSTTLMVGPIPLSVGGEVWGEVGLSAFGWATQTDDPNPNATYSKGEATWAALQGTGRLWGQGWFAIGAPGVFGIDVAAAVNFITGSVSPGTIASRLYWNPRFRAENERAIYAITLAAPVNFTSLDGFIRLRACAALCASASKSWKGVAFTTKLFPDITYQESFAATF